MTLDHEITSFVCLVDNYMTVFEGIAISQDFSDSRRKFFSSSVRVLFNYNIFSVSAKKMGRDFFLGDYMGRDGIILVDIPCNPLVVDYDRHLIDIHEVTEYISGKHKNKDYKVSIMYLPLGLPLTKKCSVIEGPLEDPDAISSLMKLHPLAKLWVLSLSEKRYIRSDFI